MARKFYAQAADSVKAFEYDTVKAARAMAKTLSMGPVTAAVYEDTGTGFDPLIERYRRGKRVFAQSSRAHASTPNPAKR